MIARSHFTRIADADEVDAKTVERDYVLTHVLAAICQQSGSRNMVFKGGTALRLCYFEDYRYSADLDFSLTGSMTTEQALDLVRAALFALTGDLGFTELSLSEDGKYIVYVGPLGGRRRIKLDLADDELVEETATVGLLGRYPDQLDVQVCVYTLGEVAAEKLRCVIQRLQARDLFDLYELFDGQALDAEHVWPSFERKAKHKRVDPARFADSFEKRMPQWKIRWQGEMDEHVPGDPTPFETIERAVRRALRTRLRST
ncbi:MAG: nucleotidyl transferase AbiEii/AbiGii toxin family protein [Baekduia sp.]